jgi:hypothetical protein
MIVNVYKTFGDLNLLNPEFLTYLTTVFTFLNGTLRLGWGSLFDVYGFKKLTYIILSLQVQYKIIIFVYKFFLFRYVLTFQFIFLPTILHSTLFL